MNIPGLSLEWILSDWILLTILSTLGLATLGFVVYFLIPSIWLWIELNRINSALKKLRTDAERTHQNVVPASVSQVMLREPFKHLWAEYSETLHEQHQLINGQHTLVARRATVPAEAFFNTEVIVSTPLRTEFFKHLPGIFTGIGIIGTFYGLITGLSTFHPSEDPTAARESLDRLITKVSQAFEVSAIAITLAMVVTFLERATVTQRHRQVERLCQLIDSLYTSGIGEEYLARLVNASEESATQTTQLKDSLVSDLKQMMTNLVDRQIEATQNSHQMLATSITQSISSSLAAPMDALSRVVERASQNQGENVQKALSDVIAGFMAKLDDTFGHQMTGLNTLMQETTASMRDTRDRFAELINNLGSAGKNASEAMAEQLAKAMEQAKERQQDLNNQMKEFVLQIRSLVAESQTKSSEKLHLALEEFGKKMNELLGNLSTQYSQFEDGASRRQEALAGQAQTAISDFGTQVGTLSDQTASAIEAMRESIAAIKNITIESVQKMNAAAETLYVAASDFSKAGTQVSGVFDRATNVADKLSTTAAGLDAAAKTVQMAVSAYDSTRTELTQSIGSLTSIVESAKREAGLSRDLIAQLEANVAKFNAVQKETELYLDKVTDVLGKSFTGFTENITRALQKTNVEFHNNLSQAVTILSNTIQELDGYLSQLPVRK